MLSKTLGSLFASIAFILLGGKVFIKLMSTDISDVIYILQVAGLGAIAFGLFGYWMGSIMQTAKDYFVENREKFQEKDQELLIDDLLSYDIGIRHKPKEKVTKPEDEQK